MGPGKRKEKKEREKERKKRGDWKERLSQYGKGLTIIRSDQCPYLEKWVKEISETAREIYGIKQK